MASAGGEDEDRLCSPIANQRAPKASEESRLPDADHGDQYSDPARLQVAPAAIAPASAVEHAFGGGEVGAERDQADDQPDVAERAQQQRAVDEKSSA